MMKRRTLTAVLFLSLLAGCSPQSHPSDEPDTTPTSKKTPNPGPNREYNFKEDNQSQPTDLSNSKGLQNFGNTCFANASLNLMSSISQIDELLNSQTHPIPFASIDLPHNFPDAFKDNIVTRAKWLQDSLSKLMTSLKKSAGRQVLSKELDEFYACLNYFLLGQSIGDREKNGGAARVDAEKAIDSQPAFDTLKLKFKAYRMRFGENSIQEEAKFGGKYYIPRDQMDAHEFLTYLLEGLLSYSKITGLQTRDLLTTDHSKTLTQPERLAALSLNIKHEGKEVHSIYDAVKNYFLSEKIYDVSVDTGITKRIFLIADPAHPPAQIILQLKRFENQGARVLALKHNVEVSEGIDLEFYPPSVTEKEIETFKPHKLTLRPLAVIVHDGPSPNSGHYYTYIYNPKDKAWQKHNDSYVHRLAKHELRDAFDDMAENGYIALYGTL